MTIQLQPEVLRWARERVGLSIDMLAARLAGQRVNAEVVQAWEKNGQITVRAAEKLAQVAHIPYGYLYFPKPPDERLPMQDFRTMKGAAPSRPSADLLDTIYQTQAKQEWYKEHRKEEGFLPLPWVGSISTAMKIQNAAEKIRVMLKIPSIDILHGTVDDVLNREIAHLESQGVLVMRNSIVGNNTKRKLDVQEFRGFAIADDYSPVIFINTRDAKTACRFTLMHELVHLCLGVSGVSNQQMSFAPSDSKTERFCNAVAAELLAPEHKLRLLWGESKATTKNINSIADTFRVSFAVILYRLHDLSLINSAQLKKMQKSLTERQIEEKKIGGAGNMISNIITRNSFALVAALITDTLNGNTPFRDAFQMLNIKKTSTFNGIVTEIEKRNRKQSAR